MAAELSYDEAKFTELVLYVAEQLRDDPEAEQNVLTPAAASGGCGPTRLAESPSRGTETGA